MHMDKARAKRLGTLIRERRLAAGLSTHQLGERIGARNSTIIRLEKGAFAAPSPDKLARIAEVLGISLADIYSHAGYAVPDDLPSFHAYLPARYRDLPEPAVRELVDLFEALLERHGLTPRTDSTSAEEAVEAAP
jgi:transcriptional regulator with XRE-family HTH domain